MVFIIYTTHLRHINVLDFRSYKVLFSPTRLINSCALIEDAHAKSLGDLVLLCSNVLMRVEGNYCE